jgi:hypothetical protein
MGDERQDPALEVFGAAEYLELIRGNAIWGKRVSNCR